MKSNYKKIPQISVIIPTYNCAKYLPGTIESVLRQSFTDFELIVIDDGSKDETRDIVAKYKVYFKEKLIYHFQENKGPSSARNKGLSLAQGEYLVFLDSDDIWDRKFLEVMFEKIFTEKLDLVICNYFRNEVSEKGEKSERIENVSDLAREINKDLLYEILKRDFIGNPSKTLGKRMIFLEINGYDEKLWIYQEWDLWIRYLRKSSKIGGVIDSLFYYYIRNDGSNITRRTPVSNKIKEFYYLYSKYKSYIEKNHELKKVFSKYLWDAARDLYKDKKKPILLFRIIFNSLLLDFSIQRILLSIKSQIKLMH